MSKRFKVGEIVIYIEKKDGKINALEIGKIKKLCKDGAFVQYRNGKTIYRSIKTSYESLFKIRNLDAISKVSFKRKWGNYDRKRYRDSKTRFK